MKRLVAFDLDGTLAESKQALDDEMAVILGRLSHVADICVISGGDWPQFDKQVASRLPDSTNRSRFWLMPTTGTKLYRFENDQWARKYADLFSDEDRAHIIKELRASIDRLGFTPAEIWGEQIEDRGSQITFSALGQQAPLGPKESWDPKQEKRRLVQKDLQPILPDVSVRIGGATSIDITRAGVDKAYGMERLAELSGISKSEILFFGDALYPGGNDAPVRDTAGIDSVQVYNIEQTKRALEASRRRSNYENFGGTHSLAPQNDNFSLDQVPDLSGKVAVVTGGSQGIGYGCTRTLLEHNISKLFIISQSADRATDAIKSIREEMGDSVSTKCNGKKCNLGDWKSVLQTADEIKSTTDRIDILINNAARGIMTAQITPYGVDEHMAINHFGHVILTSSLLPVMEETAKSRHTVRIVDLGSNAHQAAPKDTEFASLDEINRDDGPNGQYGRSKLAAMLHARYLATHVTAEHPRILANSVHPGFVDTKASSFDIHEAYPLGGYMMSVAMKPFQKSQLEGCVSAMYAATATERSGKYICVPARIEDGSELAQSNELAEQLMRLTEKVLKDKLEAVGMKFALEFY